LFSQAIAALFAGGLVLLVPLSGLAAPIIVPVGQAQATLTLTPDPPQVGQNHAVITLSGAPGDQLAKTAASFSTLMPSMAMTGPNGGARVTAPGRYEFDVTIGMAAAWDVAVRFAGGVNGTATYHVTVGSASTRGTANGSSASMNGPVSPSAAGGMAGMAGMSSSGDPGAWRTATFALVFILLVGLGAVLVVRQDRRPLTLGITIGAALITLALAALQARYATPPMDMAAMASVQGEAPIPVTLATVRSSRGESASFAPGTIAPYLTQDIVTRTAGILRDFNSYAGDRVRAGQVIATLEAPDLQSQAQAAVADAAAQADTARAAEIEAHHHAPNGVVIANAETASAERDLAAARSDSAAKAEQLRYWQVEVQREKTLLDEGAVSQQEYEDERAQAAAAQAADDGAAQRIGSLQQQLVASRTKAMDAVASVSQMQAQAASAAEQAARAQANAVTQTTVAGYTTVTSPSDGTVVKRLIDPGVYVAIGTTIARVAVIDRLRVQANVAQSDLAGIAVGTPIDATLSDGTVVRGRVSSVAPVADVTSHAAPVEAIVQNPRTDFVPGGFVRVTLHVRAAAASAGVQVPSSAIVGSGSDAAVWISVNETAHRVPVVIVSDNGTFATVRGRIEPGARVVIDGTATLQEGRPIAEQLP
jgi:RND family efflux transporter MFP subunit